MNQSPGTMEMFATYHQEELLREARNARLARDARSAQDHHSTPHHQLVAAAVVVLMTLTALVLI